MPGSHGTAAAVAVTAALLATAGCGAGREDSAGTVPLPAPSATTQQVSSANFGHLWPLSVDHGTVECRPGTQVVFVTADGTEYALNGRAEEAGIASVEPIRADGAGPGKISTGALLTAAMKLC
jgi:hypothetical protein